MFSHTTHLFLRFRENFLHFAHIKVKRLTWEVPAVGAALAEDGPLHAQLGGGAAPHPGQVRLQHGVQGVREVLVLGDGGQKLEVGHNHK